MTPDSIFNQPSPANPGKGFPETRDQKSSGAQGHRGAASSRKLWAATLVAGLLVLGSVQTALAQPPGRGPGHDPGYRHAPAPPPQPRHFHDARYHHNRSYPIRGEVVRVLPHDHRVVVHGGSRYYFSGGVWYRSHGPRFTVVIPPVGLFVPSLPPYYATIWVAGVPYYYANEVYYAHRASGYVVVDPPREEPSQTPPPAEQMFVYPRLGQDEKQQADDKYACHQWAVSQTGFDPTQPTGGTQAQRSEKRADYQRAMGACLDGRGYTVK